MDSWLNGQLVNCTVGEMDSWLFWIVPMVCFGGKLKINRWLVSSSNASHVSGFKARPESGSETRLPDPGIRRSWGLVSDRECRYDVIRRSETEPRPNPDLIPGPNPIPDLEILILV